MAGGMIGRGNGRKRYVPMADINVTPLVDVMLVLLIVFMVTAPMITSSVNVNLPNASAKPTPTDAKPLTISVDKQGLVYLNNTQIELPNLLAMLTQAAQATPDQSVLVRGDEGVDYGTMMQVMATISQSGLTKIHLLTKPGQ